jgi:hypothetical protein
MDWVGFGAAERRQLVEIDTIGVEFGIAEPFVPRALEVACNYILEGDQGLVQVSEVLGVPDTLGELFPHRVSHCQTLLMRCSWRWSLRSARRWKLAKASLRCSSHVRREPRGNATAGGVGDEAIGCWTPAFLGSPIPKVLVAGEIGGADDNGVGRVDRHTGTH